MDIKGDRRGLRCLAHGFSDEEALLVDLEKTLSRQQQFLGTASLAVEVDTLPLSPSLLAGIATQFAAFPKLHLAGVYEQATMRPVVSPVASEPRGALIVRMTLRSGQVVEHAADVVVVGDVNPGARVIAGGDVFVLGRLRGMILAGQPDQRDAVVYAIRFEPSQVRIGPVWAIPPGEVAEHPEYARLENGQIVVSPWAGLPDSANAGGHRLSLE